MNVLQKILRILGYVWIYIFMLLVLASIGFEFYKSASVWAWWKTMQEWFNPFNILNYIVTIIVLSPAMIFLFLADYLEKRATKK